MLPTHPCPSLLLKHTLVFSIATVTGLHNFTRPQGHYELAACFPVVPSFCGP